jgi:serine/threonine-protein kinase RsbW
MKERNKMVSPDRIEMVLPIKAEYVSVARLTVSGIASRIGFDIETVEDIKVAVSEVCSRIINVAAGVEGQYEILFDIFADKLVITFTSDIEKTRCIFDNDEDGLGISIINAFMDKVELCPGNNNNILSMTKTFEVISGNGL